MSVVGIDFGNLQSVIAVARNRGIDVICNEVSNRATPSLVSFGPKQRFIGESAKTQEVSNFKNTVSSLKRLAGRSFQDQEVQEIEKQYINAELVDVHGQVGVKVNYLGEQQSFSNVQLIAMYLTKLKETTAHELGGPVSDCVITVPGWFTDVQRRAILDASVIAGLNCLRLVNDLTATALGYGITKTDLPEDKPKNVVFCDIGHSSYSVSVVSFIKGQLTVRGTAYDRHFGGRNFDQVIVDRLAAEFKEKYKIDVFSNNKALFRLRTAAEKCKKVLSANPQAPVNIESIMDDKDVATIVTRADFEEWAADTLVRVETPLKAALEAAGVSIEEIDSVEIVGGSTRVPAIKNAIAKFFGKDVSTTLNQDEAVARGAALQCAMLSPVFKVREFRVHDVLHYPIKMTWAATPEEEETEIVVFDKNNSIPSTKILTFHRREPFDLEAYYANPEELPRGINPWVGRYTIKNVEAVNGEAAQIKVKARLNIHGVISVDAAYTVEEKIEEVEEKQSPPKEGEEAKPPVTKKVKKLVKKADLPVITGTTSLSRPVLEEFHEKEVSMYAADKLVHDTEEKKNALEEYVYEMRGKLEGGAYSAFIDPSIKDKFVSELNTTEDWLYDEGEDATKSVYIAKLDELKKTGSPVAERYRESEERPRSARYLTQAIEQITREAMSTDDKYSHIPAHEKQDVVDRADRARRWLDEQLAKQDKVAKHETPTLFSRDIAKEQEALYAFANPILNKPKPVSKPAEPTTDGDNDTPMTETGEEEKKSEMDID
ncbi:heat shock protein 70 family [Umbelopsis sp. PMI_123]|nr:heat shock protein 70 family [Umbelopsis sp. PMI_123]